MRVYSTYRYFGAFRFLLAALVVIQHFLADLAPGPIAAAIASHEIGGTAVLVFFALSGFVISEAADQVYRDRPVEFFTNRLLRIVPHFAFAVGVAVVLCYVFDSAGSLRLARHDHWNAQEAFTVKNVALNLVGFAPGLDRFIEHNFLIPAWAIRVEMMFYSMFAVALLLPYIVRVAGLATISHVQAGLGIFVLAIPLAFLAHFGKAPEMFQFTPYFAFGCALYAIAKQRSPIGFVVAGGALAGIALHFLTQPTRNPILGVDRALVADFALLIALIAAMSVLAFARFTCLRRLDRLMGDLTYPMYMSHPNVLIFMLSITSGYSISGLIGGLVLALAVAFLSLNLIDPAVNRLRTIVRDGRRQPVPVSFLAGWRAPSGPSSPPQPVQVRSTRF